MLKPYLKALFRTLSVAVSQRVYLLPTADFSYSLITVNENAPLKTDFLCYVPRYAIGMGRMSVTIFALHIKFLTLFYLGIQFLNSIQTRLLKV